MHRDFKGVWIPKEIYLDDNLNWTEKILLVEIDSLDNDKGCYAGNEYFAEFLSKSKVYISNCISKLKKDGYIYQESFDGRKRILRSNLRVKLKYKADLNSSLRQGKGKVKGGQPSQSQANHDSNQQKNDSINITNNLKTEEEETLKIPQKIRSKFQQIFNQHLSIDFFREITKIYSDPNIIMKALSVCEKQADKPKYLLIMLQDWHNNELKSVGDINAYIENRQAQKALRQSNKKTTATRPETPKEELQRLYEKGYR